MTHRRRHEQRTRQRFAALVIVLLGLPLLFASPAAADPPGPTDFETTVKAITPESSAFEVEIVGGDSFVLLRQNEEVTIEVIGYNGEPYLRFLPGGVVEQNRLSPAVYLNEERYGDTIPDFADVDAAPEWDEVSTGGSYAWHDHRAHWMLESRPFGKGPGDQILEAVIPLRVDDLDVDLLVASSWVAAPSPLPLLLGASLGIGATIAVWRRPSRATSALLVGSVVALIAGAVQYWSVPAETGPSLTLLALPVIASAVAAAAITTNRNPATSLPLAIGSAAALLVFVADRLPDVQKAILPTDLPMPLDRAISGFIAVLAVGCLATAGRAFVDLIRRPRSSMAPPA